MKRVFKEPMPKIQIDQTSALGGSQPNVIGLPMHTRSPQMNRAIPATESAVRTRLVRETIDIPSLVPDRISAVTSDSVSFIELSSEQCGHFRGKWRLNRVFEKTKWMRRRRLAISPTYTVACAGVTDESRLAVILYKTETNEMATYLSNPLDVKQFWIGYEGTSRQFRLNVTVAERNKERIETIAFSDRKYMPQPFQIENSKDRMIALNRV